MSFCHKGADLVIFSGGKDLRGPQASGLMVGRPDLIASALIQSAPHEHAIGRPFKPGKEAVAGLVAAIEAYLLEDEAVRFSEWERVATFLENRLNAFPDLLARRFVPTQPFIQPAWIPRIAVMPDAKSAITVPELKLALWACDPPIATEIIQQDLIFNTHTLTLAEAEVIVQQIHKILQNSLS